MIRELRGATLFIPPSKRVLERHSRTEQGPRVGSAFALAMSVYSLDHAGEATSPGFDVRDMGALRQLSNSTQQPMNRRRRLNITRIKQRIPSTPSWRTLVTLFKSLLVWQQTTIVGSRTPRRRSRAAALPCGEDIRRLHCRLTV